MFKKVEFVCGINEVRHIRIGCRCGEVTMHEVPMALERSEMLVTCPKCGAAFTIVRADLREGAPNNGFVIRRLGNRDEIKYTDASNI